MNIILKSWNQLKGDVSLKITAWEFCIKLLNWGKLLKKSRVNLEIDLFNTYLRYYEELDITQYQFTDRWYPLETLLKENFFNREQINVEDAVIVCRNLLHEILVFKSNRDCRLLGMDNLRVYEYKDSVVFCCDTCSYCEDLSGAAIKLESVVLPARASTINQYKIVPYNF